MRATAHVRAHPRHFYSCSFGFMFQGLATGGEVDVELGPDPRLKNPKEQKMIQIIKNINNIFSTAYQLRSAVRTVLREEFNVSRRRTARQVQFQISTLSIRNKFKGGFPFRPTERTLSLEISTVAILLALSIPCTHHLERRQERLMTSHGLTMLVHLATTSRQLRAPQNLVSTSFTHLTLPRDPGRWD